MNVINQNLARLSDESRLFGALRIRAFLWLLAFLLFPVIGEADIIVFEGATGITTGELLDGTSNTWKTVSVVEFSGLEISARTTNANHVLTADGAGFFGIESGLAGERDNAFDVGEVLELQFDKTVRIDQLDFNLFDKDVGDTFTVHVAGQDAIDIIYDDLDNKTSDYLGFNPGITVPAGSNVQFYVSSGTIGLDAMSVTVIPEPAVMGLICITGLGLLVVRRIFS